MEQEVRVAAVTVRRDRSQWWMLLMSLGAFAAVWAALAGILLTLR